MATEYEISTGTTVVPTTGDKMLIVRQNMGVWTPYTVNYEATFAPNSATSGTSLLSARSDHTHANYIAKVSGGTAGNVAVLTSDGSIADGGPPASGIGSITPVRLYGGIGDGSAHTIGTAPTGHILAGKTTLAQIAAVQVGGIAPFAFVTQAPFTASTWALTDGKVANLDLDWLAIQACLWRGGEARLPKGIWVIGSALPLPLLIRESTTDDPTVYGNASSFRGEGPTSSVLKAGSDFGAGVPLISCGDPTATYDNSLGRYAQQGFYRGSSLDSIGLVGPNVTNTTGVSPCQMTGIAWGCGLTVSRVNSNFFRYGLDIVGDGHDAAFDQVNAAYCYYGAYWNVQSQYLYGDITFRDCAFLGKKAGWGVHDRGCILGVNTTGKLYLNGPFAICGEAGSNTNDILRACKFESVMFEFVGNIVITDENAFTANPSWTSGSASPYTTNWKRGITNVEFNSIYSSWSDSNFWAGSGRGRVAWLDVKYLTNFKINNVDPDSAEYSPTQGPSGPTPIAMWRISSATGAGGGVRLTGDIQLLANHLTTNNVPWMPSAAGGESFVQFANVGGYDGRLLRYSNFSANPSNLFEMLDRNANGCCLSGAADSGGVVRPFAGIGLMAGVLDGGIMPVIQRANEISVRTTETSFPGNNLRLTKSTTNGKVRVAVSNDTGPFFGWVSGYDGTNSWIVTSIGQSI